MKQNIKLKILFLIAAHISLGCFAQSNNTAQISSVNKDELLQQIIQASKTGEAHRMLATTSGKWTFIGTHVFPNGKTASFGGRAVRHSLYNGRYLFSDVTSGEKLKMLWSDTPVIYHELYIEGFDNATKKFFSFTVHNETDTGPLIVTGDYNDATKTITYLGQSSSHIHRDLPLGTKMDLRILVTLTDADHFTLERHESVNNQEQIKTVLVFTRVKEQQGGK